MFQPRIRTALLVVSASVGLAGCTALDPYGYGGLSVGLGSGYGGYGAPYYGGGYNDPYGYGYGSANPYYGWNDGYYYPGTGYYVYDQNQRPYRWNSAQQGYWQDRQRTFRNANRSDVRELRDNWQAFRQERRSDDRAFRQERREDREALRSGTVTREQFREDRREDRQARRQDRRGDRASFAARTAATGATRNGAAR